MEDMIKIDDTTKCHKCDNIVTGQDNILQVCMDEVTHWLCQKCGISLRMCMSDAQKQAVIDYMKKSN